MRIMVKGAGDLATGIGWRLRRCGFDVLMTELPEPTAVRRTVAFSEAVREGRMEVEKITAVLVKSVEEAGAVIKTGRIPLMVDLEGTVCGRFAPDVLIDAVMAKRNTGTALTDAPRVIGVGPGFTVGLDCHFAVETCRGHFLGRVLEEGSPLPNTGIPGEIGGFSDERLIKARASGVFWPRVRIGDRVGKGQIVAESGGVPISARMTGMVRGMLREGMPVTEGMKCGDIDARCETVHCHTISDKARAVAGGVLEAVLLVRV